YDRLVARLRERSVLDHFLDFLEKQGAAIPAEARARDVTAPAESSEAIEEAIFRLYKTRPDVAILLELMTDFDEGLQEWRYRHVKMVERTIGTKGGTGGSSGAEYLRTTLFQPVFADLWAIRNRL
ncbi:MAG TPA: tryptophan 2,3-dioxygenase family protein, partial [Dongiaceae bacterium]|nr:tryptophan 2,3-dioxygenase family protein [Dongiaceae bacterium]